MSLRPSPSMSQTPSLASSDPNSLVPLSCVGLWGSISSPKPHFDQYPNLNPVQDFSFNSRIAAGDHLAPNPNPMIPNIASRAGHSTSNSASAANTPYSATTNAPYSWEHNGQPNQQGRSVTFSLNDYVSKDLSGRGGSATRRYPNPSPADSLPSHSTNPHRTPY